MIIKKYTLLALMFVFLGISKANAGILIEPYLGYGTGKLKFSYNGDSANLDISGTGVGMRLGYSMMVPFFALDYLGSSETGKQSGYQDVDVTQTQIAAVVGASIPFVRIYGGYILSNELKTKSDSSTQLFKGKGTKVGVSFKGIPFVSLNLEYQMNDFTELEQDGATIKFSDYNIDMDSSRTFLSVSVPFDL